jgi:hypothetical protein
MTTEWQAVRGQRRNLDLPELIIGIPLVLALVALAGYFSWHQFKTRRILAQSIDLPQDERRFLRGQSRRRLVCSVLMFLLAGMLVGWYFIEQNLPDLKVAVEQDPAKSHPLLQMVAYYWIFALFLLFGVITLASMDFFATVRFAMQQSKLLHDERREIIEAEVARLRELRNKQ